MEYFRLEMIDHIAMVEINRPQALNALNTQLLQEMDRLLDRLAQDDETWAVVVTGSGKAFVAGADIGEMAGLSEEEAVAFSHAGQQVFLKLERLPQPTIAAVNGYCLGGGLELAMACDIRLASEKARFGQPEASLGVTPGFAGTQRLPKLVGLSVAKEMLFTGAPVDAGYALRVGLVSRVVSTESLREEALSLASRIVRNGQIALRQCKRAVNEGLELPVEEGGRIEAACFGKTFAHPDQRGAMEAFLKKEAYSFINKP